ncbi:leucine--tRNA ligase [Candidatus Micrarchaeota archaeon]|nr:leucine--tRNA ligase [Candidatus Micrarchaeota archaeon]
MNFQEIEEKWQKKWLETKIAFTEPNEKEKFMLIFAYPYPTGFLHTGHMRGFTYADAIVRFKKLQGKNVCFPIGLHVTGNGAIAKAQKITEGNQEYITYLKEAGISDKELEKMKTPEGYAEFFANNYLETFKKFGLILDTRSFVKTIDSIYNKFITWQFHKLYENGLLIQKPYYATFCVNCGPVAVDPSEADISKGGKAEKNEYTLLKFKFTYDNKDMFIIAATLRPETVFGQTNLWVDPNQEYSIIQVENEPWICSKQCAEKIKYQKQDIREIGEINGQELLGKYAEAPMIHKEIIILPSEFCDPTIGTGIVTSVPSDAPHDWMGLYDLQKNKELCDKYNLDYEKLKQIKVIPIIKTPGFKESPAVEICEKLNIQNQKDPKLEEAKKEVYKSGFYSGTMINTCGKYKGMKVEEAKDKIKEELLSAGEADIFYDLSEEVICRCGGQVVIKKVENQWFIDYGKDWLNNDSIEHSKNMNIKPEEYNNNIANTLEWFKERPCARLGRWMGTTFPFDDKYTIEAISDSTLYPIFYLVSKYQKEINPEWLSLEFFDYIYLNKGSVQEASKSGMPNDLTEKIKKNVDYWYPLDINLGGKEHKTVHFPPFIKNHVAILPKDKWPKGIYVNYWITGKGGNKLSKSKGGVLPVPKVLEKYGADPMRLFYANVSSPYVDVAFDEQEIEKYKQRLEKIYFWFEDLNNTPLEVKSKRIDKWLKNKLEYYIYQYSMFIDQFELKKATDIAFYNIFNDVDWYLKRKGRNKELLQETVRIIIKLISPFTPHFAEEIWNEILKENSLLCEQKLPEVEKIEVNEIDDEDYLKQIMDDIQEIQKLTEIDKPTMIKIFIASDWKWELIKTALKMDKIDIGTVMKKADEIDSLKEHKKDIAGFLKRNMKKINTYNNITRLPEFEIISEAQDFLKERFNCEIEVYLEKESDDSKAHSALPMKPAIKLM